VTELVRVRAPASTANLGPGFDCAAAALDLWNELVVTEGGEPDPAHLGIRAYGLVADPSGLAFDFSLDIPRERGLGSSASIIALGMAAATFLDGCELDPERLLARGMPLEGHADNLAAVLAGGVCLTWDGRIARIADATPAQPIALVPEERVGTQGARAGLPAEIAHADAAYSVGRATLLGAALASGSAELFAAAADDRLHEPYRAATAPLLGAIQGDPPMGAAGVTLSGSGPTVIVWAYPDWAANCMDELVKRFQDSKVMRLKVASCRTQERCSF
jgi:homoserine kinase